MNDNYERWYDEAIEASNHLGFAGMSAAQVIGYLGIENKELRDEVERLSRELEKFKCPNVNKQFSTL